MADLLAGVFSKLGVERNPDDYRLWAAWDEVVGPAVARNAQPCKLDARRLVVAVKNATWMQELSLLRQDLCSKLNEWMGREVVSEIFLVVGRVEPTPRERHEHRRQPRVASEATRPADVNAAIERLWKALRDRDQA